jgi:hypothetical protein
MLAVRARARWAGFDPGSNFGYLGSRRSPRLRPPSITASEYHAFHRSDLQVLHSLPLRDTYVLSGVNPWPLAHFPAGALRATRATDPRTLLRLFSVGVTGSRWSGLTQQRTRQRWSNSSPSGIGPRSASYATLCASSLLSRIPMRAYPSLLTFAVHSQQPLFGSGETLSMSLSRIVKVDPFLAGRPSTRRRNASNGAPLPRTRAARS